MSEILPDIRLLIENRKHIFSLVSGLDESKLLFIPDKFKTHILWNIGHMAATQQILHYYLSGMELTMDEELVKEFRKGSKPLVDSGNYSITSIFDYFNAIA